MTTTITPTTNAGREKQTRRKLDNARLVKLGRGQDLSTAPAWIGLPDLSGVDLIQTQYFPVDKNARPRKRRWGEDWRELVIGASPYNRVSERSTGCRQCVAGELCRSWILEAMHDSFMTHNYLRCTGSYLQYIR